MMNPASLLLDPAFPADGGESPWRKGIKIPAADRTWGDCFRIAVAVAYPEIRYQDTPNPPRTEYRRRGYFISPDLTAFWDAWNSWPATLGLRWWRSTKVAPIHLPRWIAHVDGFPPEQQEHLEPLRYRGVVLPCHAVAMRYDRLLADPNGERKQIRPEDVNEALALLPADTGLPHGTDLWQIEPKYTYVRLKAAPKKELRNARNL